MNKKAKVITGVVVAIILIIMGYFMFPKKDNEPSYTITNDSLKFKEEYESLNGKDNGNGKNYLSIDIKSYNPISYSNYEEIFDILDKGTGVIYLGFPECPWCRNLVPVLVDSALEEKVSPIYYLNISGDRNTLSLTKKGKIKTEKKGTEDYLKLVDILKDYLPVYDGLKDDSIKRIYLPTVIFVKDGKVLGLEETLESYSKRVDGNPYLEMNDSEKEEFKQILKRRYKIVRNFVDTHSSDVIEALPFNSGYFMSFHTKNIDAESLRVKLLEEKGIGTISIDSSTLRVAFSSIDEDKIEQVYSAIYETAGELSRA